MECNKRFGWTADETLKLIQSLYEKKTTTYPRVDTTYLSDDIYPKIPEIMRQMTPYADITAPVLAGKIPKSKKVFDNSKVTDHHAIIPTGQSPAVLTGNERHLYHLIAQRFIAAFYPDCEFNQTTAFGRSGEVEFKAIGKVITRSGWRDVLDKKTQFLLIRSTMWLEITGFCRRLQKASPAPMNHPYKNGQHSHRNHIPRELCSGLWKQPVKQLTTKRYAMR